jgi:F-type H+-transporting ATPase subunit b
MPQIDVQTFSSQIFWLLLSFGCVTAFVCGWFAPRLLGMATVRQNTMEALEKSIEVLRSESQSAHQEGDAVLEAARKDVSTILARAHEEAEKDRQALQESLTRELRSALTRWEKDFRKEQKAAQSEMTDRLGSMVTLCLRHINEAGYDEKVMALLDEVGPGDKTRH